MDELIARLERATKADQSDLIREALKLTYDSGWITADEFRRANEQCNVGAFVDAALTALPEGWGWTLHSDGSGEIYRDVPPGMLPGTPGSTVIGFDAETPALGLCTAILRALTTEKEG